MVDSSRNRVRRPVGRRGPNDLPHAIRRYGTNARSRAQRTPWPGPHKPAQTGDDHYPQTWNRFVTTYMDLGYTYKDASTSATDALLHARDEIGPRSPQNMLKAALDWADHGFTPAEAHHWSQIGWDPAHAVPWANSDWTPTQVRRLLVGLIIWPPNAQHGGHGFWAMAQKWQRSTVPPTWAIRYVWAGLPTPAAARPYEQQRRNATTRDGRAGVKDLLATLDVLAAIHPARLRFNRTVPEASGPADTGCPHA